MQGIKMSMLKDEYSSEINIPSPSHEKGKINKRLLEFVDKTLPVFQTEFKGLNNSSEEVLTEHLVKTFAYHSNGKLPFIFLQEVIQKQAKGQNRKVDVGVFLHYKDDAPFFTFEAKRLPTLPKSREKEYVIGNDSNKPTGGIERFKLNLHGINLKESGMIGYIQSDTFQEWSKRINSWINELIGSTSISEILWSNSDLLINTESETGVISRYKSTNERTDRSSIILHHYLVDITVR
jgi:hypothetical protein